MERKGTPLIAVLVEDEALLALVMEDVLTAEGFDTILVSNETDARAQIARAPAVAVVNLSLASDIAGQRIISFLRRSLPNLPVVVVTGYACDAEQADLRGVGGPTIRLHKPEHINQLAAAVWDVLDPDYLGQQRSYRRRQKDKV